MRQVSSKLKVNDKVEVIAGKDKGRWLDRKSVV